MDWVHELGWDQWSFTTNDIIGLVIVYAIIAICLGLYHYAKNRWKLADSRKIVHIGVGQFIWIWWIFSAPWIMLVFFTIPFTIILYLAMYDNNPIGRSKLGEISKEGTETGLFYYALAITVLALLCFNHWVAATIGVVAMTFGDGFGSVIGKRFGKHKIFRGKSLEGTLAVYLATSLVTAAVILFYTFLVEQGISRPMSYTPIIGWMWVGIVGGIVAAVTELLCRGRYDNIILATVTTLVMIGLGL